MRTVCYLNGRECSHDGGRPEAVRDQREVSEVALDAGVEDLLGARVAERGAVLVQQVHQLLCHHPADYQVKCEQAQDTYLRLVCLNIKRNKIG